MTLQGMLAGGLACVVAMALAYCLGRKSAQLSALRTQQRQQEGERNHAQQLTDRVLALSADDARRRLHDVANKQR